MKIETKLLFFYLSLDEREQVRFRSLLGPKIIEKIVSQSFLNEAMGSMHTITHQNVNSSFNREDYDIAVMQIVRHIGQSASSNVELAKSIEGVINHSISRPEKRSRYELQGMFLEALMNADREKLLRLRNEIMHGKILGSNRTDDSNLDRWFSIILGDQR